MQKQLALKIAIIFILGLIIFIAVSLVSFKIADRKDYFVEAKYSVSQSGTSEQIILSPIIVIPYQLSVPVANNGYQQSPQNVLTQRYDYITAEAATVDIQAENSLLYRGIYEIPVYTSAVVLSSQFSMKKLHDKMAELNATPHFASSGKPFIALHLSDMRGIMQTPSLMLNGAVATLEPGSGIVGLGAGLHRPLDDAALQDTALQDTGLSVEIQLQLRGMDYLAMIPVADESKTTLQSTWPHPDFTGASLPAQREISAAGFNAEWTSTRFSNNHAAALNHCLLYEDCHQLLGTAAGVRFIVPVDIYLQSERSIKYAMLFIGLSFITFFIFEHLRRIRIHPIQYAFVGLAIAVFYLLLISLAEHIAFHWAYSIAVLCCNALLLFYVRYMLKSVKLAAMFTAMMLTLYGLLYVIVQAEDFALLMGTLLVFAVLTVLMYITRKIDWYNLAAEQPERAS